MKNLTLILLFLAFKSFVSLSQNYYEMGQKEFVEKENYNESVILLTKAIENNQELAKSFMYRGAAKTKLKDYYEAISDFTSSLKIDTTNYMTYYYLSRCYCYQGFYITALKYIEKAILLNRTDADLFDLKAAAEGKLEYYDKTIKDDDIAINLNPKDGQYYSNRGYAKIQLKQYIEAIEDFDSSIKIKPTSVAFGNKALALFKLKKYRESIDNINKAIELDSSLVNEFYYYRGLSYKELGEMDNACKDFKKGAEIGYLPSKTEYLNCIK